MGAVADLARQLRKAAQRDRHRRMIVLHGDRDAAAALAAKALDAAGIDPSAGVLVGERDLDPLALERVPPDHVTELMGTTVPALVYDAHDALEPNGLGRTVGTVDAGGLYLMLAPPLDRWPETRDGFDAHLAVPPFSTDDVTGRFRTRLVETLRRHDGIAIVDADTGTVEDDGHLEASPADIAVAPTDAAEALPGERFPADAYEACRTRDQARALAALEALTQPGHVVVIDADRGRGKSSAAGLAAGALVRQGARVLVTAPRRRNTDALFARAGELLHTLDVPAHADRDAGRLTTPEGTGLSYMAPADAVDHLADADVDAILVDEAAGLPVHLLEALLDAGPPIAFTTTVHGYEGAGRSFSVRFKGRLDASQRPVTHLSLDTPIRYAPHDPVEAWAFHALALDAHPATAALVDDAAPETTTYTRLIPDDLLDEPRLLSEAFGLLVLAHYRTSPNDLARLLDAPNLTLHALTHDDHVAAVALVAREGGLPEDLRERIYEGATVPGHLIPDVLTSQLRDETAAAPTGYRIVRIATHPTLRRRGLGSALLDELDDTLAPETDWLGTAYGATPELVRFWRTNGYRTVHLATSRHPTSGEHSAIMLAPTSGAGEALHARSTRWLVDRLPSVLADALSQLDPDVVREATAAIDAEAARDRLELDLTDRAWRHVAAAAYGVGVYDANPAPFRRIAMRHLVEQEADLDPRQERLIVTKVLQARPWPDVAERLGYVSERMCKRALAEAYRPLIDRYGTALAKDEAERYR